MQSSNPQTPSSKMEFFTGSHVLKIAGYSLSNDVGIGKCIISDTLIIGGYKWNILYYPDGSEEEDKAEYISVFVQLIETSDTVKALLDIKLLDVNDNPSLMTPEYSKPCIFDYQNQKFGFARFVKKRDLNSSSFLKDDNIVLKCTFILMKASSKSSSSSKSPNAINTSSTMEFSKGTHILKIFNYSFIKDMRVGECIKSNTFCIGGHQWNLIFYPNPQDEIEHVSIFIQSSKPTMQYVLKVLYEIKLLDDKGKPSPTRENFIPCSNEGNPVGFIRFMKKSDIEALGFSRNNTFIITCSIITIKESRELIKAQNFLHVSAFTSSVIDLILGSHTLTICGYSCSKGIGFNKHIKSKTFSIGGYEWCLVYYPDGCKEEDKDEYISFQLFNTNENVEALFQIKMLDENQKASSSMLNWYSNSSNVIARFMKKSDLEASGFLNEDHFMVKCTIVVLRRSSTLLRLIHSIPENPNSMSSEMKIYTGCHYLTIIGYSESKGIGIKSHITSNTFTIGGHDWCILYYPDGCKKEDNAEYISVFLRLLNTSENVTVLFNGDLIDGTKTLSSATSKLVEPYLFKGTHDSYGATQFLKKSYIDSFLKDDILQIKCTITVLREPTPQNELPNTSSSSSSVVELVNGSHVLTIAGYSCIRGIGIGKYIVSDVLPIGGYGWSLHYGYEINDKIEYLSLFIELLNTSDNVKALYRISLLNNELDVTRKVHQPQVFKGSTYKLGFQKFITRQELETSGLIVDDTLTIRCVVTVIEELEPLQGNPRME